MAKEKLGELDIDIKIDFKKVNKALGKISSQVKKVSVRMAKSIKSALGSLARISLSVTKKVVSIFTNAFKRVVRIIRNAMLVSGAAISAFLIITTKMAIDVEEMQSLFKKSFGDMTNDVRKWSTEYSKRVKTNRFDTESMIVTMFNVARAMGLSGEAAVETAKELVMMSDDLKSAFNLKGDVAFDKIRSGIIGMSRPLQDLGIDLRVAAVEEFALSQGMKKVNGEFTNQQKILARTGLLKSILKNIDVMGDMEDTLDSTQNRIRALTDGFREWSIEQGMVTKSSKTFLSLLTKVEKIAAKLQKTIGIILVKAVALLDKHFDSIVATFNSALIILKPIGKAFGVLAGTIQKVTIEFSKNVKNMGLFKKALGFITETSVKVILSIDNLIKKVVAWLSITKNQERVLKILKSAFDDIVEVGKVVVSGILGMGRAIKAFVLDLDVTNEELGNAGVALFDFLTAMEAVKNIIRVVSDFFVKLNNFIFEFTDRIGGVTSSLLTTIVVFTEFTLILTLLKSPLVFIKGIFFAVGAVVGTVGVALGLVTSASVTLVGGLATLAAAVGWLGGKALVGLIGWLENTFGWFDKLTDKIDDMISSILELISKIPGLKTIGKILGFGEVQDFSKTNARLEAIKAGTAVPTFPGGGGGSGGGGSGGAGGGWELPTSPTVTQSLPGSPSVATVPVGATGGANEVERQMLAQLRIMTAAIEAQPGTQQLLANKFSA